MVTLGSGMKSLLAMSLVLAVVFASGCTQYGGQTQPTTPASPQQPAASAKIIEITSSGFSPSTLTINSGEAVTFVNKDTRQHWPASNPHPVHTGYSGFDAKHGLNQGESYSFTFTRKGTFGFHDHLNPGNGGTIAVK